MLSLPVIDVTPPSALQGQVNGRLSSSILTDTPGLAGGPRIRLLAATSTRAWQALAGTAMQDNVILKATSPADSYRTYEQQVWTFTSRYQLEPIAGRPFRLWDSDNSGTPEKWYQLPNTAVAAVPGTSNHGWGLAVDVADAAGARLDWMLANAIKFGWSWETQSEPWHIRYVTGDTLPFAVLAYERTSVMQCLIRYSDDPVKDRVWLADRMFRRRVTVAELVDDPGNATYLASVIAGVAVANGPVADISSYVGGFLGNSGRVFQTGGFTGPNRDAWGAEYPFPVSSSQSDEVILAPQAYTMTISH